MIEDIRLHGQVNPMVEYFATIAGRAVGHQFFYEPSPDGQSGTIRFFAAGHEFLIGRDGLSYKGNGGSFCRYMFGVNLPLKDLVKKEVVNRLVLNGAILDPTGQSIRFTDQTDRREGYEEVFRSGNALCNYYFFVQLPEQSPLHKQQESLLRLIGRAVKHSPHVAVQDDVQIAHTLYETLKEPRAIVYLFKLTHRGHAAYYHYYQHVYAARTQSEEAVVRRLGEIVEQYTIDLYQQTRMQIDVVYQHPDNKRLIDEYKDLLVDMLTDPSSTQAILAKLNRLRTLSVRHAIPLEVFHTLDGIFLKDKTDSVERFEEPEHLSAARSILDSLFLQVGSSDGTVLKEELATLLRAKRQAIERRDFAFDALLLDVGKSCDEYASQSGDARILERFSLIVTCFDRFDATYTYLNQMVFMDDDQTTEAVLKTIHANKKIFDDLAPKLFKELFIDSIVKDRYLNDFGRRKIFIVFQGLKEVDENRATLMEVANQVRQVNTEALVYRQVHRHLRKFLKQFVKADRSEAVIHLRDQLSQELVGKGVIPIPIPEGVFHKILRDLHREAVYFYEVLPTLVASPKDSDGRRDAYFSSSGVDRYELEELEREYFHQHRLDETLLQTLQR
ncbi:MAG: TIGR04442 family protein [Nitrospiria bacterium]